MHMKYVQLKSVNKMSNFQNLQNANFSKRIDQRMVTKIMVSEKADIKL